jgi:hypothetical protein
MVASEASTATGLLPMHEIGAGDGGAEREAAGDTFGQGEDVGRGVKMFGGEHAAGAAHAGLDFVGDEENAVACGDCGEFVEELARRDDVAAFALHGLDDDGGDFLGGDDGAEDLVFQDADAFYEAGVGLFPIGAAVAIGVWNVGDTGNKRTEPLTLQVFGGCKRK